MTIVRFYVKKKGSCDEVKNKFNTSIDSVLVRDVEIEFCYYIETQIELSVENLEKLNWILCEPFGKSDLNKISSLSTGKENELLIEIGPRLSFSTPFCTNAVSICHHTGLKMIRKIERSTRYLIKADRLISSGMEEIIVSKLHDPMTQMRYLTPLESFETNNKRLTWYEIDVLKEGELALRKANIDLGLAMDDQDIKLYTELFQNKLKKNPTSVECFDLAQSNSEHSRHWYFNGIMTIDGKVQDKTMFQLVKETQLHSNNNNVIAFCDNSSAIKGYQVDAIAPEEIGKPSSLCKESVMRHITLTAETHNFPTGVAPFPGATTGTGGRQRDQHAAGRGSHVVAGTAGYCVGILNLSHHELPWEDHGKWKTPSSLATSSRIIIEASDGASDYGNKFGEPVIAGFFRSFGMKLPDGERREWLKPIMFSGGIGSIENEHVNKFKLEKNPDNMKDLVVGKIGGPAYCIGVGGGSASSLVQGDNTQDRDFNAVQRGDAQMQQKLNRVVRSCIEMKRENPILSIHDQGAGGNGNVLKEIVDPAGAIINTESFTRGDSSLTTLELWVAEYQESDAILLHKNQIETVKQICKRERSTLDVVGELTGDGRIILSEGDIASGESPTKKPRHQNDISSIRHPVDLDLEHVLGKMKPKEYDLKVKKSCLKPVRIPKVPIRDMLLRVLKLPSVSSKRFLTNKVDRSVTGLIAQQQCVGPLHTPLADVAVTALSHFTTKGSATAIGEQPIKMLVDPCAGARLTVGEALTNLVFAGISDIRDIKCSGNWMWPAKLPGEGAAIYAACKSMCEIMNKLGIAVDGGKDSLSMAARVDNETVKCPGALVVSAYAPCPDITVKVTPDLKCAGKNEEGHLVYVPMSKSLGHLGGSALAQCFGQIGNEIPDLDDVELFINAWKTTQRLIKNKKILSGHDVSDGGLITCLLEMAFAGNCGIEVNISSNEDETSVLFSERLGLVLETACLDEVLNEFASHNVNAISIGKSRKERQISISVNDTVILSNESTNQLRDVWESTSFALEHLQCDNDCVEQERKYLLECIKDPPYHVSFDQTKETVPKGLSAKKINVAILREEGSNGDREMCAAFMKAGFKTWDVTMQDLLSGDITVDRFRGIVFVGGFSYADVFGSAKGWAACSLFNEKVREQFDLFFHREDTFSLGVCNGCQLMALLGWIGNEKSDENTHNESKMPNLSCYLTHNKSGRFESRFVTVKIIDSPSIMLKGMDESQLGVWVAHGEGQFKFKDESVLENINKLGIAPIRFIDNDGIVTTKYPFNPNGSEQGIAGLCSTNGRHLAIMPHPERSVEMWQFPWIPQYWNGKVLSSPWEKMFSNAMNWCLQNVQ
uniref:phosphoribosylformylglycinamidine synthase-like n=1 Tax=Styela clava TaxID=7725 RepID=UPI001939C1B8|nr:phosphoribosylformylglycinamidine synthase-like [Styela clava]